jgi:hypothetical protein
MQHKIYQSTSLKSDLILFSHLYLSLSSRLLPLRFLTEPLYTSPTCATHHAHLIIPGLTVTIFGDKNKSQFIQTNKNNISGSHGSEYDDESFVGCSAVSSTPNFQSYVLLESILALMMEAVCTPETSVYFNDTTRHCIPKCCYLQKHDFTCYVVRLYQYRTQERA